MTLPSGYQVGPYEIVAPIGAGGMGEVYRARDGKLGREVALKILPPELVSSGEHLRRFEQEARAASALNHPNIITIYDIGRTDSVAYIAMELVQGRDLRELMLDAIPLKEVLRIACKVADGLAAAHERGIVHRDLKPENLMITGDGFVKILDFGLAKLMRPFTQTETTAPHTVPGSVFGTVGYMSPEQASGRAIDFRSDQFALGVMLHEVLARRRPFDRSSPPETMTAIIREDAPPIVRLEGAIPPELQKILNRLLAKDPNDRYAATRDLARDLREVRDHLSAMTQSGRRSGGFGAQSSRRVLPIAVGSVALSLLAIGGFVIIRNEGETPPAPGQPQVLRSMAVLPFRDLSKTADGQLFADGLSDTLSARLAKTRQIRVAGPFVGAEIPANADLKSIAARRGTSLLLRGGVHRTGEKLRVTYTLYDAEHGSDVGGDSITGDTNDLLSLEDAVAESVLQALGLPTTAAAARKDGDLARPEDRRSYLEAVGLLRNVKDDRSVDQAIDRLEALLRNSRDSASVNGWLGYAYLAKYGRTRQVAYVEQSTIFAERAAQLDPNLPDVHVTLGELRRMSGRLPEAEQEFKRAIAIQPEYSRAVLGLADTYTDMGRAADAERQYKRAIEIAPDDPDAYTKYGRFSYRSGAYRKAIDLFQKMTSLLPDSPRGYVNLGAAYQALGEYEKAQAAFQRSISIRPTSAGYSNLGTCQYSLGRFADAAASFQKAVELTPGNYVLWVNLGDALRWVPERRAESVRIFDRAIEAASQTLSVNRNDPLVHAVIGACKAKNGRLDEARTHIDQALRIDPTNPAVLYQAAVVAHLRGDQPSALMWLQRSVKAGYPSVDASRDPEFRDLRESPDFEKAIQRTTTT